MGVALQNSTLPCAVATFPVSLLLSSPGDVWPRLPLLLPSTRPWTSAHPPWPLQPKPQPLTPSFSNPPLCQTPGCRSVHSRSNFSPSHPVLSALRPQGFRTWSALATARRSFVIINCNRPATDSKGRFSAYLLLIPLCDLGPSIIASSTFRCEQRCMVFSGLWWRHFLPVALFVFLQIFDPNILVLSWKHITCISIIKYFTPAPIKIINQFLWPVVIRDLPYMIYEQCRYILS